MIRIAILTLALFTVAACQSGAYDRDDATSNSAGGYNSY